MLSRLGAMALVVCLVLQGMAMSVQRAGGRSHHHVPVAGAATFEPVQDPHDALAGDDPHHDRDQVRQGRGAVFAHVFGRTHDHRTVADHEHAAADASVVHADGGDPGATKSPPASASRSLDADGLAGRGGVAPAPRAVEGWPPETQPVIRSFIASPMDRPPIA